MKIKSPKKTIRAKSKKGSVSGKTSDDFFSPLFVLVSGSERDQHTFVVKFPASCQYI